jgi:hypothetical protein
MFKMTPLLEGEMLPRSVFVAEKVQQLLVCNENREEGSGLWTTRFLFSLVLLPVRTPHCAVACRRVKERAGLRRRFLFLLQQFEAIHGFPLVNDRNVKTSRSLELRFLLFNSRA